MKKIIFGIFVFLINGITYAQSLELTANTETLDINNPLQLTISISNATQGGNIGIKNLNEHFDIISQSQSQSIQVINGKRSASTQFQIQAKAKKVGKWSIGPAQIKIGTGLIESNTLSVSVTGEKLFVNGQPQGRQNNPTPPPVPENIAPDTNTRQNTTSIPNKNSFASSWRIFLIACILIFLVIRWQRKKEKEKQEKNTTENTTKSIHDTSFEKVSENTINEGNKKQTFSSAMIKHKKFPNSQSKSYPENLEQRIRCIIAEKLHIDTSSLTFKELHTLRASSHGKTAKEIHDAVKNNTCMLYKTLTMLEQYKYGGKEIDKEKLDEMAKGWKRNIKDK